MSREKLDEARQYIELASLHSNIHHLCRAVMTHNDLLADKQPGPSDSSTTSGELNVVSRASESTDSIPTVGKQYEWSESDNDRLRKAIAGNIGGNDLCHTDPIEQLEQACIDAGQMAWNLGIRVIQSDKLHEEEVERLTAERDVVRREIEAIREACGWEQESELTSVLVERMHADLKDLRQDLEEVNEFARSLGHGQGAIDNGLVDCLRESFAKYEQLRGLVREFQEARRCRVKWGDVMPANISVYGQVFENRDEYKRFGDAVTQLSGFQL